MPEELSKNKIPWKQEIQELLQRNPDRDPVTIPCTTHCFGLHGLRCQLQCKLWCMAASKSVPSEALPDHKRYGWKGNFEIQWMLQLPAPIKLLEFMHCKSCQTGCDTGRCVCKKANVPCTDLCGCHGCKNCAAAQTTSEQVPSSVGANGAVETSLDEDYGPQDNADESSEDGEGEGREGEEGEGAGYEISDDFAAGSSHGEEMEGEEENDEDRACAAACGMEEAF